MGSWALIDGMEPSLSICKGNVRQYGILLQEALAWTSPECFQCQRGSIFACGREAVVEQQMAHGGFVFLMIWQSHVLELACEPQLGLVKQRVELYAVFDQSQPSHQQFAYNDQYGMP
jgi:hypothetical protein